MPEKPSQKKPIDIKTFYKISTDIVLTAGLVANFGPGVINTIGFFGNMALNSVTGQSFSHPRTYETSK